MFKFLAMAVLGFGFCAQAFADDCGQNAEGQTISVDSRVHYRGESEDNGTVTQCLWNGTVAVRFDSNNIVQSAPLVKLRLIPIPQFEPRPRYELEVCRIQVRGWGVYEGQAQRESEARDFASLRCSEARQYRYGHQVRLSALNCQPRRALCHREWRTADLQMNQTQDAVAGLDKQENGEGAKTSGAGPSSSEKIERSVEAGLQSI